MSTLENYREKAPAIRTLLVLTLAAALQLSFVSPASAGGGADTYSIFFDRADVAGDPGTQVTLGLHLANDPLPVDGFSFGVRYDGDVVKLASLDFAAGLNAVVDEPDARFFAMSIITDGASKEIGFTVAFVVTQNPAAPDDDPIPRALAPGQSPHHLFDATFDLVGTRGNSTNVQLAGDLGSPTVEIVIDLAGTSQEPVSAGTPVTSVFVRLGDAAGEPFIRGDVDQGGSSNITDAINSLRRQFLGDASVPDTVNTTFDQCLAAYDVSGDGQVAVGDPIFLLSFLFAGGSRPPQPFGACGLREEGANMTLPCLAFTCAP